MGKNSSDISRHIKHCETSMSLYFTFRIQPENNLRHARIINCSFPTLWAGDQIIVYQDPVPQQRVPRSVSLQVAFSKVGPTNFGQFGPLTLTTYKDTRNIQRTLETENHQKNITIPTS